MKTLSKKIVFISIFLVAFGGGLAPSADNFLPDDATISNYVKEAYNNVEKIITYGFLMARISINH